MSPLLHGVHMNDNPAKLRALRKHLDYLLGGGGAHLDFEAVVSDISPDMANQKHQKLPYTMWQVLEHMRIAQWDILEFTRNPGHESPAFPDGYWPSENAAALSAWTNTIEQFRNDLEAMRQLVADPETDLFEGIAHGDGQTVLREALLVADHNAYHLGVLTVMKRLFLEEGGEAN